MRKKLSIVLFIIGVIFLINAIFGRYIVLPGYLATLESGTAQNDTIPSNIEIWKVARYILWAFSFKLGIYFIMISALLKTEIKKMRLILFAIMGILYILVAYLPIPGPRALFGIGGGIMTVLIILIMQQLSKERNNCYKNTESAVDYRIIGYFFFAMATYNLCPLLGVKCFALEPVKMIKYGLQAQAISYASHILIELVLGWIFIFLSHLFHTIKQTPT